MLPCFERRYVFDLPPTQDASHHQDYSNSNKGSQTKPSLCHCYWEGATPNICIYIYMYFQLWWMVVLVFSTPGGKTSFLKHQKPYP